MNVNIEETDEYKAYLKTDKWKAIAGARLKIDGFKCNACRSEGTMNNPLEVHHLSYKHLYHEENWIYQDLVSVCHNCHKSIHAVMYRITDENGRRGWKDNQTIPRISVYTITGETMESRQIGNL